MPSGVQVQRGTISVKSNKKVKISPADTELGSDTNGQNSTQPNLTRNLRVETHPHANNWNIYSKIKIKISISISISIPHPSIDLPIGNYPQKLMEISLISDTLTTIATKYGHGLGLSNFVTDRHSSSYDQQLQIYAIMVPIDSIAPPLVKPRTAPKKLARKRCRVKRSSKTDGDDAYVDEDGGGFFDGGDGPFGGGGGGGGGGGSGDNFDGFVWDESLPASPSDPAFDFVYEVLCWIVFSNCLHFAFKRVIRIMANGVADPERRKVPLRFTPIW